MEATEESTGKNVELYEHFDVFPSVKQINRYPFSETSLVQLNMCGEKPGKRLITQFGHAGVFPRHGSIHTEYLQELQQKLKKKVFTINNKCQLR